MVTKKPSVANSINPMDYDRLVVMIARKCGAKAPIRDSEQYANGWLGLLRACELFDPSLGFAFTSYAYQWILNKINRPVKDMGKMSAPKLESVSYSQTVDDWDPSTDRGEDHQNTVERYDECNMLLRVLDNRSREIVQLCIMNDETYDSITTRFGISRARIGQIIESAIHRMQCHAKKKSECML